MVTGGSSGIGLSCARLLVAEGAAVMILGRDEERLGLAEAECSGGPGEVAGVALDLLDPATPAAALAAVERRFGGVDGLVNCAGRSSSASLEGSPESAWWAQWEINVIATKRMIDAFAPAIAARGGGAIVNVSSSAGRRPSSRDAPYAVTKRAQLALTEVCAQRYADAGVAVNAVAPGATATPLWLREDGILDEVAAERGLDRDAALTEVGGGMPLGRLAEPEEIAAVIALQLRRPGPTGTTWSADGGHVPDVFP